MQEVPVNPNSLVGTKSDRNLSLKQMWPDANISTDTPSPEYIKAIKDIRKQMDNTNDIAATLTQRGNRYGKFTGHAKITQDLKRVMHETNNWKILTDDQKESLEMVAHKIGRILNGDPNYDDSWVDIAGYTKLVADRLTTGKEV